MSLIAVVDSTDLRDLDDHTGVNWLDRPMLGAVHAERLMDARPVVIGEVLGKKPSEMLLMEHVDVFEAFAADRANQPFHVGRLPG